MTLSKFEGVIFLLKTQTHYAYLINKGGCFYKKIGIAPKSMTLKENNSCMDDYYRLGNNYIKRVAKSGGVPEADSLLPELFNFLTND